MKHITSLTLLTLASMASLAQAGDEPASYPPAATTTSASPDAFSKIKFTGNIRTRYEFRETDPADASHALTARARIGLEIGSFGGFSAFVEGEGTQGIIEDFRSNPTGNPNLTDPYVSGNSVIADPNNAELNQAYLKYAKDGFFVQVGRQRIIRNSAAFIGNVGWRQNEQTFDAAQIGYKNDNFSVSYVYSDRARRIFGEDAPSGTPLREFKGDFHLLDLSYKADFGTVGGYAYLIDVDPVRNQGPLLNVGESNTFGVFADVNGFHAEVAFQDGTSNLVSGTDQDYTAGYAHLKYSTKVAGGTGIVGVEYLGEHFKTPFATVHAFNGFADAFILQRIGLNGGPGGNYNGITDIYLGYVKKGLPGGITFKGFLHYFADAGLNDTYGYEADAVFVKKFNDNLTGVMKAAYFSGEDFYEDIKQVSLQLDYKF